MALTYGSYLNLEQLLAAQRPLSDGPEHDELLFIVIHQVYELWFKQLLHEARRLARALEAGETHHALATLKRMLTILKTLVAQVDILETMTPMSFNSFRNRLDTASGFESVQFRLVEFALGHKRSSVTAHYPEGSPERAALERALTAPTLWDSFLRYLAGAGFSVPGRRSHETSRRRSQLRRTSKPCCFRCTGKMRSSARCASAWWISMRVCRSGATDT